MNYKGVTYNSDTAKYEARMGQRMLGEYKSAKEAALAYNEQASKIFTFPILNKIEDTNEQETDPGIS